MSVRHDRESLPENVAAQSARHLPDDAVKVIAEALGLLDGYLLELQWRLTLNPPPLERRAISDTLGRIRCWYSDATNLDPALNRYHDVKFSDAGS